MCGWENMLFPFRTSTAKGEKMNTLIEKQRFTNCHILESLVLYTYICLRWFEQIKHITSYYITYSPNRGLMVIYHGRICEKHQKSKSMYTFRMRPAKRHFKASSPNLTPMMTFFVSGVLGWNKLWEETTRITSTIASITVESWCEKSWVGILLWLDVKNQQDSSNWKITKSHQQFWKKTPPQILLLMVKTLATILKNDLTLTISWDPPNKRGLTMFLAGLLQMDLQSPPWDPGWFFQGS